MGVPALSRIDRDIIFNELADSLTHRTFSSIVLNDRGDVSGKTTTDITIVAEIQELTGEEESFQVAGVNIKVGDAWGFFKHEDNVNLDDIIIATSSGSVLDTWTESASYWICSPGSVTTNTDSYVGSNAIELTTNPATSLIQLTFPSAQDTTGSDRLAFFTKLVSGSMSFINYIRCYTSAGNWFGIDLPSISGTSSFIVNEYLKTSFVNNQGSPNWNSIAWIEIQIAGTAVLLLDGLGFYNSTPAKKITKWKVVQKVVNDPSESIDECVLKRISE